jgi:hypothetical protein
VAIEDISQGIAQKEEDHEDIMIEDIEVEVGVEVDNIEVEEDIVIDMIVEVIAEVVIVGVVEIVKAGIIDIEEDLEVEKEVMIVIIEIKKGIEDPEVKEAGIVEIAGIDLKKVGNLKIQKGQIDQEAKKDMLKIMIIITKKIILIVIVINLIMIVLIIKTIVIILKKKIIIKKTKLSGMRSN